MTQLFQPTIADTPEAASYPSLKHSAVPHPSPTYAATI